MHYNILMFLLNKSARLNYLSVLCAGSIIAECLAGNWGQRESNCWKRETVSVDKWWGNISGEAFEDEIKKKKVIKVQKL